MRKSEPFYNRTYLEVQDDGPDEAQRQFVVSVDDFLSPDVHQLDLLVPQEVQGHLNVLDHVEAHATFFTRLKLFNENFNDSAIKYGFIFVN